MLTLEELLRTMVERGGSDLHIAAGSPRTRIDGVSSRWWVPISWRLRILKN